MPKRAVNLNPTRERPLADYSETEANSIAELMEHKNLWTSDTARQGRSRTRFDSVKPLDLAVFIIVSLRRAQLYRVTDYEIGAALGLDPDDIARIYSIAKSTIQKK